MDKYLFLFKTAMGTLCGWECFDPKEPVSEAQAVQQAFNMLVCDDLYDSVEIYSDGCHFESSSGRLLICKVLK